MGLIPDKEPNVSQLLVHGKYFKFGNVTQYRLVEHSQEAARR